MAAVCFGVGTLCPHQEASLPFIEQDELDKLQERSAELDALRAEPLRSDPATSIDPKGGPGRNALFSAIQQTRMPMILTDPHQTDNPIIFANRAFVQLSGYSEDELVGRNCRFLQGNDTLPDTVSKIREAVASRTTIAVDTVNYRKNGERFINELYVSPIFAENGDLLYFFGSQVDISAYIETHLSIQLTLIERERHVLRQIAEGVPLPQVLADLLLLIEAQYDPGTRTSILFLSEDRKHLRHGAAPSLPAAYNDTIDGMAIGEGQGSCGTVACRGTPVYASDIATDPLWADFRDLALSHDLRACWSTPIKAADERVLGTFAIYYDVPRSPTNQEIAAIGFITQTAALAIERHQHEMDMRRSEEKLSTLNANLERAVANRTQDLVAAQTSLEVALAAADMGGWDIDLTSGQARRTPRHDSIFGYDTQLLEWSVETFLSHVQPGHRDRIAQAFKDAADTGTLEIECPIDTTQGKERWITAKGRIAYDDAGTPVRMSGVVFDITKRKETEAQLAQAQKMEAVGQLTGGVAHDFNNLLTIIRGSVDLLRRPNLSDVRRMRHIDAIGETADRAAKLTAQLLAFARRQALAPATFDSGASIQEVGSIVRTLVGSRIKLRIATPDDPCFVVADRGQFDTAIINMSVNARDAMEGEGELTVTVGPVSGIPSVRVHPPVDGDFVAVTVRDTGCGIDPAKIARIFEPFYTTKGPGHGTGLGLSQVFGFAKQSDGDIRVDSALREGSTFTLYLPRARNMSGSTERDDARPEPVDGEGACVLLVEDNEEVGEFAEQALRELGYRSVLAADAPTALGLLREDRNQFDIVFSDVVMPGMDGLEMGQEIRRLYADLPVILTSGYSHVLARNGQHGFELLHKPYSVEQLSRVLRKSLCWSRSS